MNELTIQVELRNDVGFIGLKKPRRIVRMRRELHGYLENRFRRNNHPKYHKYCDEWINNTTIDQLRYFIEEKRRIESGVVLK